MNNFFPVIPRTSMSLLDSANRVKPRPNRHGDFMTGAKVNESATLSLRGSNIIASDD